MTNQEPLAQIKLFCLANTLTEHHLDQTEQHFEIDLGRKEKQEIKRKEFYLQFDPLFRKEARLMAEHYEVFYCLEKSIRRSYCCSTSEPHIYRSTCWRTCCSRHEHDPNHYSWNIVLIWNNTQHNQLIWLSAVSRAHS